MLRLLTTTATILASAFIGGFFWFVSTLSAPAGAAPADVEGIVVLTGAGGKRISTAVALLEDGVADRLLISGVHPATSREAIAAHLPAPSTRFECCADIGQDARSTVENAHEARVWARRHEFQRLILVTSDYHMPRALLELRNALPDMAVTPFPAESTYLDEAGRPTSGHAWRRLFAEYVKYLAVRLRTALD